MTQFNQFPNNYLIAYTQNQKFPFPSNTLIFRSIINCYILPLEPSSLASSSKRRILLAAPSSAKCHRKETWERIRRRPSKLNSRNDKHSQDVWIKRESVHTQTKENEDQYSQDAVDSSSGLDDTLPRIKPPRPTNLPLCEFSLTWTRGQRRHFAREGDMQIARLEMPIVVSFFSLSRGNIQYSNTTTTFVSLTFAKQLNDPRREEKVGKYFERRVSRW